MIGPWTMSEFQDVRSFILRENPELKSLRVYTPVVANVQAEWIVTDFLRASHSDDAKPRKLHERFNDRLPVIQDVHKKVWPDRDVAMVRLGQKNTTEKAAENLDRADRAFPEKTMPTTLMMCATVLGATSYGQNRNHEDRMKSFAILQAFVNKVCSASGGFEWGPVKFDTRGFANRPIFRHGELADLAKSKWDEDLLNGSAYWVRSNWTEPHLADMIGFTWQNQKKKGQSRQERQTWNILQPHLTDVGIQIVSLLAEMLHKYLHRATVSMSLKRKSLKEHSTKKLSKRSASEVIEIIAKATQKLYDREDGASFWSTLLLPVVYIYIIIIYIDVYGWGLFKF